eukprot:scaffold60148_cov19-Tisochrysis_lutea.AAC.1
MAVNGSSRRASCNFEKAAYFLGVDSFKPAFAPDHAPSHMSESPAYEAASSPACKGACSPSFKPWPEPYVAPHLPYSPDSYEALGYTPRPSKKKIQNPYKPSYHPSSPAYNGSLSPYSYDALDYNPTSSKKGTRNPYLQYSPDPHNALDYNPRPSKKVAPNSAKPPTYLPSKPEPCKSSPLSDYSASSQDACIPSLSSPSYLDIGKAPQASAKLGAGTKARSNKPRLQAKQPKKPSQLVQLKKKRQLQRKEQRAKAKAAKKERLEEKRLQKVCCKHTFAFHKWLVFTLSELPTIEPGAIQGQAFYALYPFILSFDLDDLGGTLIRWLPMCNVTNV